MNWETAKTWLVWAFLILDVLLGWQLVQSRKEMFSYVESYSDLVANTKTLLAQHGFSLDAPVPEAHPSLPSLRASFPNVTLQELTTVALPNSKNTVVEPSAAIVTSSVGNLRALGDGTWQVTFNHPFKVSASTTPASFPFLWHPAEYVQDTSLSDSNFVVFMQKYQGYPIFDAQVVIQTGKGFVTGFTQSALANINPAADAKPIISALDALTSLANAVDKSNQRKDNKIRSIELGYSRKVTVTPVGAPLSTSNYWFPVWRVVTDDQIYYVNALSGEVDTTP